MGLDYVRVLNITCKPSNSGDRAFKETMLESKGSLVQFPVETYVFSVFRSSQLGEDHINEIKHERNSYK